MPDPILQEDGITALLRQAVHDRKPRGARKIAEALKYHEAHIRNMFTRYPVSESVADFLGYRKMTVYIRKDIAEAPWKINLIFSGRGLFQP